MYLPTASASLLVFIMGGSLFPEMAQGQGANTVPANLREFDPVERPLRLAPIASAAKGHGPKVTLAVPTLPVQSSYETSTAVDPTSWSHIPDTTYGGLRPPPPGWTSGPLGRRDDDGGLDGDDADDQTSTATATRTETGTATTTATRSGSGSRSSETRSATRSQSDSGTASSSAPATSSSSSASRRLQVPGVFAALRLL